MAERRITKTDQANAVRRALVNAMAKVRITQGQRDAIIRRGRLTEGELAWLPDAPQNIISTAQEMLVFTDERDWDRPNWTTGQWIVLARVALDSAGRIDGGESA